MCVSSSIYLGRGKQRDMINYAKFIASFLKMAKKPRQFMLDNIKFVILGKCIYKISVVRIFIIFNKNALKTHNKSETRLFSIKLLSS